LRIFFRILAGAAAVLALLILVECAVLPEADEMRLSAIQRTFIGLDRQQAYSHLHGYWLTPYHIAFYMRGFPEPGMRGFPEPDKTVWPSSGDVVVLFPHARRQPPEGACGASAMLAIHFGRNDRVTAIRPVTNPLACL
jgi:hypothetical protein